MFGHIFEISILAVVAATFVSFLIGGVWFGVIVRKPYQNAMGKQDEPIQKPGLLSIFGPSVCNLIIICANATLIHILNINSIPQCIVFGIFIALGYLIPVCMMIAINPNFPRPFFYTLINLPYLLAVSILSSMIIVAIG